MLAASGKKISCSDPQVFQRLNKTNISLASVRSSRPIGFQETAIPIFLYNFQKLYTKNVRCHQGILQNALEHLFCRGSVNKYIVSLISSNPENFHLFKSTIKTVEKGMKYFQS